MTYVPGSEWRISANSEEHAGRLDIGNEQCGDLVLDEVVIDKWCHFEQLDTNFYWANIGGWVMGATVDGEGEAHVWFEWQGRGPAPEPGEKPRPHRGEANWKVVETIKLALRGLIPEDRALATSEWCLDCWENPRGCQCENNE